MQLSDLRSDSTKLFLGSLARHVRAAAPTVNRESCASMDARTGYAVG